MSSDSEDRQENRQNNLSGYGDGVSYCIYNEEDSDEWIRSTLSVEQNRDEDGYSTLCINNWRKEVNR